MNTAARIKVLAATVSIVVLASMAMPAQAGNVSGGGLGGLGGGLGGAVGGAVGAVGGVVGGVANAVGGVVGGVTGGNTASSGGLLGGSSSGLPGGSDGGLINNNNGKGIGVNAGVAKIGIGLMHKKGLKLKIKANVLGKNGVKSQDGRRSSERWQRPQHQGQGHCSGE